MVVAEKVGLALRGPDFEVLSLGFIPVVLDRVNLVEVVIQGEPLWAFIGPVAGLGIDVEGEGHGVIIRQEVTTRSGPMASQSARMLWEEGLGSTKRWRRRLSERMISRGESSSTVRAGFR